MSCCSSFYESIEQYCDSCFDLTYSNLHLLNWNDIREMIEESLILCIRFERLDFFMDLLKKHPNPNFFYRNKEDPHLKMNLFHFAAKYDRSDFLCVLHMKGVDATLFSCDCGFIRTNFNGKDHIQLVCNSNKFQCDHYMTPLSYVCRNGSLECLKTLSRMGVSIQCPMPCTRTICFSTPILYLYREENFDMVRYLLRRGISQDHIMLCCSSKETLIQMACKEGKSRYVRLFLDFGADLNQKDSKGKTLIQITCEGINRGRRWSEEDDERRGIDHKETIRTLIERGINLEEEIKRPDNVFIQFCYDIGFCSYLLQKNKNFIHSVNAKITKLPILMHLISIQQYFHESWYTFFIRNGADVNCGDSFGITPLMLSVSLLDREVTELLLREGAEINRSSNKGSTILHALSVVARDYFANQNINPSHNFYQQIENDKECKKILGMLTFLLESGANPTIRNSKGILPKDIFPEYFHPEIEKYECDLKEPDVI